MVRLRQLPSLDSRVGEGAVWDSIVLSPQESRASTESACDGSAATPPRVDAQGALLTIVRSRARGAPTRATPRRRWKMPLGLRLPRILGLKM